MKANVILHTSAGSLQRSIKKRTFTSTNVLYHFIRTRIQMLSVRNEQLLLQLRSFPF